MNFRYWMEGALYDERAGYYTRNPKIRPDYVTAPNFGPYLGLAVAQELARAWELLPREQQPKVFTLVEAGCGPQATMMEHMLRGLQERKPDLFDRMQAILVDRSLPRLNAAAERLMSLFPDKIFACPDISQIPRIWGAVVSNELADAMPVRLIRRLSQELVEEGAIAPGAGGTAALTWAPCDHPVVVSYGLELPVNTVYALNLDMLEFFKAAKDRLEHGFVITIDYGDERPTVFQRSPLKAYRRGALWAPSFSKPGSQDLTSPVDFSLLLDIGNRLGFEALHYETLGSFLIRNGIAGRVSSGASRTSIESNLQIKSLIHPYGFGEDFKVLIQGK
ncbi:MAG: SAM-dependent methyltransferase [Elusimicrobia bacterium]|nr:SAM-dependent methyltransferase [Elusimicrobiota bacterium]